MLTTLWILGKPSFRHYGEAEYQDTFDEILASLTYENGLTLGIDEDFADSNGGSRFDF